MAKRNQDSIHPGEIIQDELDERGWTQADLARILGRPVAAISEMVHAKRSITVQTARELAEAFGTSAEFWLKLENAYQLELAGPPPTEIARRARLYEKAPLKEMERRGWLSPSKNMDDAEAEYCRFFSVSSVSDEPQLRVAARQSLGEGALSGAQMAWCYRALQLARCVQAANYKKASLERALLGLRELAEHPEGARKVPAFLALLGVRLVIVEALRGTRMDGAALWIEGKYPVVALSMRFDRIDWFWHTLGHELSHVIHEDRKQMVDVSDDDDAEAESSEIEGRANRDAAALLIPEEALAAFISRVRPLYSKDKIIRFANRVQIHPGIVVGQLQHRDEIRYNANREMLVPIRSHILGQALTDGFGHQPQIGKK